jgi:hypothetical protein
LLVQAILPEARTFEQGELFCSALRRADERTLNTGPVSSNKYEVSMPLIQVLIALIVVGVLLWLVNTYIPMQSTIKSILNAVVVIVVVLWLLNVFGVLHSLTNVRVGN